MDKLTKDQKDEYATSFAALALYDVSIFSRNEMITSCATKFIAPSYLQIVITNSIISPYVPTII